ncbi:glycosyltransferase [Candidatus Woesearchaeota archaeon]|nr:glycosyltransferase [Candidatus Woesearchaeota archaeon]
MKIALLTASYFPEYNGASIRIDGIAQGLSALGHQVYIFVPGIKLSREIADYAVVWRIPVFYSSFSTFFEKFTKFHLTRFFAFFKHLRYIIKKEGIDLIHTRQPLDFFLLGYFLRKKVHWAVEVHKFLGVSDYENGSIGVLRKNFLLFFERFFMNASDVVVTMTTSGKSTLQQYGITSPIIVVSNASSLARRRVSSPFPRHNYLLYAGNLRDVEGIDQLLRSFAIIHKELPNISCVIIGGGDVKKWQEYAKKLHLENSVIFLGEIPYQSLLPYYQHALLFVHPRKNVTYHKDIIGLKFYDALRVGLPFVTSDVGEMGDLIKKYSVGVVTRPEDDVDFAQKIITLLHKPQLLSRLKKNALHYSRLFSWKQSCICLSKSYLSLVREGKHHD